MVKIVQKENPVLRETALPVSAKDMGGKKLLEIVLRMKEALASQEDGVAIAAPQIGVPLRMFVISGKMFQKDEQTPAPDRVFINPEITKTSKDKAWMEEGCLSVRWHYGEVNRYKKATVRAYNEHGVRFTLGGSGLLAQIFQHETDHLNGILFIDTARNIHDVPPENPHDK